MTSINEAVKAQTQNVQPVTTLEVLPSANQFFTEEFLGKIENAAQTEGYAISVREAVQRDLIKANFSYMDLYSSKYLIGKNLTVKDTPEAIAADDRRSKVLRRCEMGHLKNKISLDADFEGITNLKKREEFIALQFEQTMTWYDLDRKVLGTQQIGLIDECHNKAKDTVRNIRDGMQGEQELTQAIELGLSTTPEKKRAKTLGEKIQTTLDTLKLQAEKIEHPEFSESILAYVDKMSLMTDAIDADIAARKEEEIERKAQDKLDAKEAKAVEAFFEVPE
tara:strand:- start:9 stop:845 length:837 start_codon:yes stop_codon:yes gene_type:complete